MNNRAHVITSSPAACSLTCLRHALRSLHAGIENLFGGDEEDAVRRLIAIHNLQLLHQEVHTAVHVLLPHLRQGKDRSLDILHVSWHKFVFNNSKCYYY